MSSTRPRVPLTDHKRRRTREKIQPPPRYFVLYPPHHHLQSKTSVFLRGLHAKYQPKLPLRVHLTKHVERDVVGTINVRALEDQHNFGEHWRFNRGDDITKEV